MKWDRRDPGNLRCLIRHYRKELQEFIERHPELKLSDPQVIAANRVLDGLIDLYQKAVAGKITRDDKARSGK